MTTVVDAEELTSRPASHALDLYRGDSRAWRVTLWADTGRTQPYDLAGISAAAQIRADPDARAALNLDCQIELPNIVWMYLPADRAALAGNGAWDLQLSLPGGEVATVLRGPVTVTPDVTR